MTRKLKVITDLLCFRRLYRADRRHIAATGTRFLLIIAWPLDSTLGLLQEQPSFLTVGFMKINTWRLTIAELFKYRPKSPSGISIAAGLALFATALSGP